VYCSRRTSALTKVLDHYITIHPLEGSVVKKGRVEHQVVDTSGGGEVGGWYKEVKGK
jgi:hypothetical protein